MSFKDKKIPELNKEEQQKNSSLEEIDLNLHIFIYFIK